MENTAEIKIYFSGMLFYPETKPQFISLPCAGTSNFSSYSLILLEGLDDPFGMVLGSLFPVPESLM